MLLKPITQNYGLCLQLMLLKTNNTKPLIMSSVDAS